MGRESGSFGMEKSSASQVVFVTALLGTLGSLEACTAARTGAGTRETDPSMQRVTGRVEDLAPGVLFERHHRIIDRTPLDAHMRGIRILSETADRGRMAQHGHVFSTRSADGVSDMHESMSIYDGAPLSEFFSRPEVLRTLIDLRFRSFSLRYNAPLSVVGSTAERGVNLVARRASADQALVEEDQGRLRVQHVVVDSSVAMATAEQAVEAGLWELVGQSARADATAGEVVTTEEGRLLSEDGQMVEGLGYRLSIQAGYLRLRDCHVTTDQDDNGWRAHISTDVIRSVVDAE